MTYCRHTF